MLLKLFNCQAGLVKSLQDLNGQTKTLLYINSISVHIYMLYIILNKLSKFQNFQISRVNKSSAIIWTIWKLTILNLEILLGQSLPKLQNYTKGLGFLYKITIIIIVISKCFLKVTFQENIFYQT